MTTLATMKARIASELRRSNITTQIASAITTAIEAYQTERFFWDESRENTFLTVASQEFYTSTDAAFIANILKIDFVHLYIGDAPSELRQELPRLLEDVSTNGTATGTPDTYGFYDEKFRLYPVPLTAGWTVRVGGVFKQAAPASDSEANNPWMTTCERLIRSRAKFELAVHVLLDQNLANAMSGAVTDALDQLIIRTTRITKTGGGRIVPMNF